MRQGLSYPTSTLSLNKGEEKKFLKIIFRNDVHIVPDTGYDVHIAPVRKKQIKGLLSFEITSVSKSHKSGLNKF